jgi:UTP--glucose-1-phosphate uridylyltransferase
LIDIHDRLGGSVIALEEVSESDTGRYGVISGVEIETDIYEIKSLVEKPKPSEAPSNLAVIGRYILTRDIFDAIKKIEKGVNGEFQLTDALNDLAKTGSVYGVVLRGKRYDVGDKLGFVKATIDFSMKRQELSEDIRRHIMSIIASS